MNQMSKFLQQLARCFISLLAFAYLSPTHATAEQVDELVHTALVLDAHPKFGGAVYKSNCATCHGSKAEGNATRGIPALASQRVSYLVKQFADFSERDRDSDTMHRVIAQKWLRDPQTWIDVATFVNALPAAKAVQTG